MSRSTDNFAASIIIPAHNEESGIGKVLSALPESVHGRPLQVIVACNGCTDGTSAIAKRFGAKVIEIRVSSKIAALNAADSLAEAFPRLYVDADIQITSKAVFDLVQALSQLGALCAAPPSNIDVSGRPWLIRSYFAFWSALMTARSGYVGAGIYAVSQKGRERFAEFPEVIADDAFIRNLFSRDERVIVRTDPTIVGAPHSIQALLRRRIRVYIGNEQLAKREVLQSSSVPGESKVSWWKFAARNPRLIPSAVVYVLFNAIALMVARARMRLGRPIAWGRDESTRKSLQ